jgi:hypothetical protein
VLVVVVVGERYSSVLIRYDAFLHHIFRQTQGDAWFRPDEGPISGGVCLRVSDSPHQPEWRVFPYENADLEPFQEAVSRLNPAVAVKVRSAAVHAALSDVSVLFLLLLPLSLY